MRPLAVVPVLVLLTSLLISGCLQSTGTISHLGEGLGSWTSTDSEPWFALTGGCGFCAGDPYVPEASTLIVYEDGSVLWYRYGMKYPPEEDRVRVVSGLQAWEGELEEVVPLLENYYVEGKSIHVHELAADRIDDETWSEVAKTLTFYEGRVEDPGEPRYDCEDCGATHVEILGEKGLHAKLHRTDPEHPDYGNYRDQEPWGRLLAQLRAISDWVRDEAS